MNAGWRRNDGDVRPVSFCSAAVNGGISINENKPIANKQKPANDKYDPVNNRLRYQVFGQFAGFRSQNPPAMPPASTSDMARLLKLALAASAAAKRYMAGRVVCAQYQRARAKDPEIMVERGIGASQRADDAGDRAQREAGATPDPAHQ